MAKTFSRNGTKKIKNKKMGSFQYFQNTKTNTFTTALQTQTQQPCNMGGTIHISGEDIISLWKEGRLAEALGALDVMDQRGIQAIESVYVSLLHACAHKRALSEGKLVHTHMADRGFEANIFLSNTLVNMYTKCGSLADARIVLDSMPRRNVVSWTAMIAAYTKQGCCEEALKLFHQMQRAGVEPNHYTFASVLPACAHLRDLEQGKEIHDEIVKGGLERNVFVASALVNMYVKCGSIENARQVFDKITEPNAVLSTVMIAGYAQKGQVGEALKLFKQIPEPDMVTWTAMVAGYVQNGQVEEALDMFQKMPERDVVSWTAMISGCAQNGDSVRAIDLFQQMYQAGVRPGSETFASLLPACGSLSALEYGEEVHENVIKNGFQSNVFVGSALVDMYIKCGRVEVARKVFDKMTERNVVSWNSMIVGYTQNRHVNEALRLFQNMPERNVVSWNAMISGYVQNGQVDKAIQLFQEMPERDVVSWTAMIAGYSQNGLVDEAMKLFEKMPEKNAMSWNTMIAGCAQSGNVDKGLMLFQNMPGRDIVSWNTMIAGFVQNGHVDQALKLFQQMPEKNVISWTAMIAGYAQNGHFDQALKLFQQMQVAGVKPNSDTFSSVIPACSNLAALNYGKQVHDSIYRNGFQSDVFVESALVDMYAKCGSIENAYKVFCKMHIRDVVSWNAMIVGYAMHGLGMEAIQLFKHMQQSGINPNDITFVGVLSACCHAGLVDDGRQYFDLMRDFYHIRPTMEHYCCMVDLLGRAGCLDEAEDFINQIPMKPSAAVWVSLLGACRNHTNVELAERVANHLFDLDPKSAAPYVLMSNIYAATGRWDDIQKVRKMMKDRNVTKNPGCSWIEMNKSIYAFVVGDKSNPQMKEIYVELERLSGLMKESGYLPNTRFALTDVEEEQKEHILCHHSEKLAIAFGLINTSPGTPIRVIKNLRVCGDCHVAIKFISRIAMREIVVRDATRFHHFVNGLCSCGDYW
jgi:pentatricopeptide repeat protein